MPSRSASLLGKRFGMLVVTREMPRVRHPSGSSHRSWECRCDCGTVVSCLHNNLTAGRSTCCGCTTKNPWIIHGDARRKRTPEYSAWVAMRFRCRNPRAKQYPGYGGRGITVCERWLRSYEDFLADMGRRPSRRHSLGRKDNDGPYSPGNCRWEVPAQQTRNTRYNIMLTFKGETRCVSDWADVVGIPRQTIYYRIAHGWNVEQALTQPVRIWPSGKGKRASQRSA